MTASNKYLIIALTVIAGFGVISCGPQKVANTTGQSINPAPASGNSPIASCSTDVAGLSDLGVKIQTYSMSGVDYSAWTRVRFHKFISSLDNASQITFWAYSMDASGNASVQQRPSFYVEYINGSNQAAKISNDVTSITWSDLKAAMTSAGIATANIATAMAQVNFVVKFEGPLSYSQVIQPTVYLNSGSPDRYLSALIPKFYASPVDYAIGKPVALQSLHPMKNYTYGTSAEYYSQSQSNCIY